MPGLDKYQSMRDFEKTAEPSGKADPQLSELEQKGRPRFVVQEHHATALHWDFRLEKNGVLVSWAVPRGLPPDPRVNHLAVHTEDHPLSYFDFEGSIPRGEYGGGKVILWDQGTYEEEKFSEREVMVVLHGERARGKHVLFRTDGKNWMMHRMDPADDPSRELMPGDARPIEPVAGALPDDVDGWRFAVAWEGTRAAVSVDGGRCIARTAKGNDVTKRWPELGSFGRAVGALPVVFTGVLVRPQPKTTATFFVEDIVWLDGHATGSLPFSSRRSLLDELELDGGSWRTSPLYDDPGVLLTAAAAQGLPGVLGFRDTAQLEPPLLVSVG
ncbi:MAG TPA: DNA polymerase ligase N-terminal domain-containing protein [Acidimicrobiales bacterium]|nr:DNA polymerase ligase N-terminal domain-containing protein [Acidimicrobiales bacterium]